MVYFLSTVFLLNSFLMQIFLMCQFGQETMSEYNSLSNDLFCSDWPGLIATKRSDPGNCQMILVFLMESLNRNTMIRIGKVFPLDLKMFSSVKIQIISKKHHLILYYFSDFKCYISTVCYIKTIRVIIKVLD